LGDEQPTSDSGLRTSDFRSGFAALAGRPNAGKSTLLNALVGEHIAAVSTKPQTTRTRILGILTRRSDLMTTRPEGQIVFVDTPGIHKPGYLLNRRMMGIVAGALEQVDVVLLLRDATTRFGAGDRFTLELVKRTSKPAFLLLNKIDLVKDKARLLPLIEQYRREHEFAEVIPISARTGDGQELLVRKLLEYLPPGPPLYDPEIFTDQIERHLVAELVREKLLELTGEELPFATAVRTEHWQETEDATEIHCVIYVERASQKPILIGRQGQMLKQIGTRARRDIEQLLDRHVRLYLFVRVQEHWRNDPRTLDELGIEERRGGKH
jgi:GTP-binding protein Era